MRGNLEKNTVESNALVNLLCACSGLTFPELFIQTIWGTLGGNGEVYLAQSMDP